MTTDILMSVRKNVNLFLMNGGEPNLEKYSAFIYCPVT